MNRGDPAALPNIVRAGAVREGAGKLTEEARKASEQTPRPSATASGTVKRAAHRLETDPERFRIPTRLEDLFEGGASRLDQVVAVRRALYRTLPVSVGGHIAEFVHRATYAEIAERLRGGDLGLWCAGASFVFQRALESLGFRAWTLHVGFDDDLTHAVTIVDVEGEFLLQDSYLNESCGVDVRQVLPKLQIGEAPPMHRETRDRKIHLIPANGENTENLDWCVRNAEMELPPVNGLRRFVLVPQSHRDQVMKSWTGRNFERLRSLALPQDNIFLLLNPIGMFDGAGFETLPSRMPIIGEWLEKGGRTLTQELDALERSGIAPERSDEAPSADRRDVIAGLTELTVAGSKAELALREGRALHAAEIEAATALARAERQRHRVEIEALVKGGDEERARFACETESLMTRGVEERARHAAEIDEVRARFARSAAEHDQTASALRVLEGNHATLLHALQEFELRVAAVEQARGDAEYARADAERRMVALDRRSGELEMAAKQIAAELTIVDVFEGVDVVTKALAGVRKLVGELHAAVTRTKLVEKELAALREQRISMTGEIAHLSAIVNRSRYLRWRRKLASLFRGG